MCLISRAASTCRPEESMALVFKTNTLGPLLTTQAFLPLLRKGGKKQASMRHAC